MERLAESDPAASAEGPPGTLRWTPNDAYTQAHSNKSEYAGRVRGVSKNILSAWGSIICITHRPLQDPKMLIHQPWYLR